MTNKTKRRISAGSGVLFFALVLVSMQIDAPAPTEWFARLVLAPCASALIGLLVAVAVKGVAENMGDDQ